MSLPKCIWGVILKEANWFPARRVNRTFRGLVDAVYVFEKTDNEAIAKFSTLNILLLYKKQYRLKYRKIMFSSCLIGNMEIINHILKKSTDFLTDGLEGACYGGQLEIANLLIEKGATDRYWSLRAACQSGHMQIVLLLIEKGAVNWDLGLYSACRGSQWEIALLMIHKGATNWDWGLSAACFAGDLQLVELLINKGADFCYNCKKFIKKIDNYLNF